mmetsp:Transcript_46413/g.145226  ORF Transcript_46413/g.145226 Transcript_46413/m.145226 type:complete len:238 (+) Transcript_46413:3347-4060(+)
MRTPLPLSTSESATGVVRPPRPSCVQRSAHMRTQLMTVSGSMPGLMLMRVSSGPTTRSISSSQVTTPPCVARPPSMARRARSAVLSGGCAALSCTRLKVPFAAAGHVVSMLWNTASAAASSGVSPSPASSGRSWIPPAMAPVHALKSAAASCSWPAGQPPAAGLGSTSLPTRSTVEENPSGLHLRTNCCSSASALVRLPQTFCRLKGNWPLRVAPSAESRHTRTKARDSPSRARGRY